MTYKLSQQFDDFQIGMEACKCSLIEFFHRLSRIKGSVIGGRSELLENLCFYQVRLRKKKTGVLNMAK